jgi:hypothetical protein
LKEFVSEEQVLAANKSKNKTATKTNTNTNTMTENDLVDEKALQVSTHARTCCRHPISDMVQNYKRYLSVYNKKMAVIAALDATLEEQDKSRETEEEIISKRDDPTLNQAIIATTVDEISTEIQGLVSVSIYQGTDETKERAQHDSEDHEDDMEVEPDGAKVELDGSEDQSEEGVDGDNKDGDENESSDEIESLSE